MSSKVLGLNQQGNYTHVIGGMPCIFCGCVSEFMTVLPYGSRYDGEWICGDCVSEKFDPVIEQNTKPADLDRGKNLV